MKLNASFNDYNHSEFPTAQDASGVSDPEATNFQKRQLNGVLQLQHHPLGRLRGTLGLWTNFESMKIRGDEPLGRTHGSLGLPLTPMRNIQPRTTHTCRQASGTTTIKSKRVRILSRPIRIFRP